MKWNSNWNEIAWISLYATQGFEDSSFGWKIVQEGSWNTYNRKMVWKYFQRLSHVRSLSSVEENIEDEMEPEKKPQTPVGREAY